MLEVMTKISTPLLAPSEATVQLVQQQLDNRRLLAPHVCPAFSVRWEEQTYIQIQGVSKKPSFTKLSICRFATNIISISSQLAAGFPNAQFGKTQFFQTPCTIHFTLRKRYMLVNNAITIKTKCFSFVLYHFQALMHVNQHILASKTSSACTIDKCHVFVNFFNTQKLL